MKYASLPPSLPLIYAPCPPFSLTPIYTPVPPPRLPSHLSTPPTPSPLLCSFADSTLSRKADSTVTPIFRVLVSHTTVD